MKFLSSFFEQKMPPKFQKNLRGTDRWCFFQMRKGSPFAHLRRIIFPLVPRLSSPSITQTHTHAYAHENFKFGHKHVFSWFLPVGSSSPLHHTNTNTCSMLKAAEERRATERERERGKQGNGRDRDRCIKGKIKNGFAWHHTHTQARGNTCTVLKIVCSENYFSKINFNE